jgi:hypothetical protein
MIFVQNFCPLIEWIFVSWKYESCIKLFKFLTIFQKKKMLKFYIFLWKGETISSLTSREERGERRKQKTPPEKRSGNFNSYKETSPACNRRFSYHFAQKISKVSLYMEFRFYVPTQQISKVMSLKSFDRLDYS